MKKIIRLTEKDLTRIVKRTIKESEDISFTPNMGGDLKSDIMDILNNDISSNEEKIHILKMIAHDMERSNKMTNNVRDRFRNNLKENESSNECERLLTEMEYVFNDFMKELELSSDKIDPVDFYDDLESELGEILDMAYEHDCDEDTLEYMEESYEEFLFLMSKELDL